MHTDPVLSLIGRHHLTTGHVPSRLLPNMTCSCHAHVMPQLMTFMAVCQQSNQPHTSLNGWKAAADNCLQSVKLPHNLSPSTPKSSTLITLRWSMHCVMYLSSPKSAGALQVSA